MKKIAVFAALIAVVALTPGCLTSKKQVVTGTTATGFTPHTVVTVNQAVLDADCLVVKVVATQATQRLAAKGGGTVQTLRDIETALNGIISGANTGSAGQVIKLIGVKPNDTATADEVTQLVKDLSDYEQSLIQKYGATVAGQISLAIAKAVYAGMAAALPPV
jgi:LysM repeat protein